MSNLGERLTELMLEQDMASLNLAQSIGVTVQTVNRWKRGEKQMNLSNLIAVCNALHCTLDFLVGRSELPLSFVPKKCPPFYLRLKEVMRQMGISRYRLTKETNIKDSYLYLWKKGSDTKIPALIELADYFDVTIDFLVGREE